MQNDNIRRRIRLLIFIVAFLIAPLSAGAWQTVEYCDVYAGPNKVFTVTNTPVMSALDRAQSVTAHIEAIVANPVLNPEHLSIRQSIDGAPVIMLDNVAICSV